MLGSGIESGIRHNTILSQNETCYVSEMNLIRIWKGTLRFLETGLNLRNPLIIWDGLMGSSFLETMNVLFDAASDSNYWPAGFSGLNQSKIPKIQKKNQ